MVPGASLKSTTMQTLLPHLLAHCEEALLSAEGLLAAAKASVRAMVASRAALDRHQRAAHALAWVATYVEALRQMARWARRLEHDKRLGEIEQLLLQPACGEYLAQLAGGIPMSQTEIVRPIDLGLDDVAEFWTPTVKALVAAGTGRESRAASADHLAAHAGAMTVGDPGLDETMGMVRDQFSRFAQDKVAPFAHGWHMRGELMPLADAD